MAKSRYTNEQKMEFVMAFKEATGSHKLLNAEEIARWCNKTYKLVDKIYGRDFRRPEEMKEWFEHINAQIRETIKKETENEKLKVITASLIDIEHIIKTCRNTEQLRAELQKANKRFVDIVDTCQLIATELKEEKEKRLNQERDVSIVKDNMERLQKTMKAKEKKWKISKKKMSRQIADAKRIQMKLMKYICRYIVDPVMANHFVNELRLIETYPGREIVLPEQIKELTHDNASFGTIISAFDDWFGVVEDDEILGFDEENEVDEFIEEKSIGEPVRVITEGEAVALSMLDNL